MQAHLSKAPKRRSMSTLHPTPFPPSVMVVGGVGSTILQQGLEFFNVLNHDKVVANRRGGGSDMCQWLKSRVCQGASSPAQSVLENSRLGRIWNILFYLFTFLFAMVNALWRGRYNLKG